MSEGHTPTPAGQPDNRITGTDTITFQQPSPQEMTFTLARVSIRKDGKLTYHEGYEPDAAARQFWEAVARNAPYGPLSKAAPEMLAALQLVAHDVRSGSLPTDIQNAISAAIARATGQAKPE